MVLETISLLTASLFQFLYEANRIIFHLLLSHSLLVLDEMDQLNCHHQEVLYSLFEWSSLPHSKLILIGKTFISFFPPPPSPFLHFSSCLDMPCTLIGHTYMGYDVD